MHPAISTGICRNLLGGVQKGSNESRSSVLIPVNSRLQKQTFPSRNTSRPAKAGMGCTALSPSFHGNLLLWKLGRWRGKGRWGQKWEMEIKKKKQGEERKRITTKRLESKVEGLLWRVSARLAWCKIFSVQFTSLQTASDPCALWNRLYFTKSGSFGEGYS